ncbi:MAG TPA: PIG-L family deacetylase [Candidatus Saccharimonadales bacterium]|nr:PIG-L family deacetylase [Candidatus Saccharimonadales bacterium]
MARITSPDDIKQLGTIMSVWAHPDDESFTSAGIMATAVKNGQQVVCITATKGEAGVQDESRWPAAKLGEIRAKEMQAALKKIGITDHYWLNYQDGLCNCVQTREAVAKIKDLIEKYQPDSILTFGPDGITGHTDHQTVSKWVDLATEGKDIKVYHTIEEEDHYQKYMIEADKKFDIYFNIDKPPTRKAKDCDIAYDLPERVIDQKYQALKAMPSQTEAMIKNTPDDMLKSMLCLECFVKAESK